MRRGLALLAALLTSSCAGASSSPTLAEEHCFRLAGALDSWVLHLRPDGTFSFYLLSHFAAQEGLTGFWRPTGEDGATLRCDRWSRVIVADPIRVCLGRDWEKQLPHIRTALATFLRDRAAAESFSRDALEEVGTWEEDRPPGKVTVLPIIALEDRVPRAAVEKVLVAIDRYGRGEDPREVHVRFHRHRSVEFMEWLDWSGYRDRIPLEEMRAQVERLGPGESAEDVWMRMGRDRLEKELQQRDGLRFILKPRPDR